MARGDGKAPVLEIMRAGMLFARTSLPAIAPAALLASAVSAAVGAALSAGAPAPLLLVALAASLSYQAFLLRLAIHQDRTGLFGLKLAHDEGRLLAVALLTAIPLAIVLVSAMIVVGAASAILLEQSGIDMEALRNDPAAAEAAIRAQFNGPSAPALWGIAGAFLALGAWISARLAVAPAATIAEGKIMALSTFAWTRGNAWRILAALAPFQLMTALQVMTSTSLAGGAALPVMAGDFLLTLFQFLFVAPGLIGATAYLYRGFRPPA